ncbi:MAG: hypothetical protein ABR506_08840 [Candidatus Krumholzibacteriia bacterium]
MLAPHMTARPRQVMAICAPQPVQPKENNRVSHSNCQRLKP